MFLPANMRSEVVLVLARRFMPRECLPDGFGNISFPQSLLVSDRETKVRNELAFCAKGFMLEKSGKDRHLKSIPRFQSDAQKTCEVIPKTFIFAPTFLKIEKFRITFLHKKLKLSNGVPYNLPPNATFQKVA
jgi:hypothetical protein